MGHWIISIGLLRLGKIAFPLESFAHSIVVVAKYLQFFVSFCVQSFVVRVTLFMGLYSRGP
jgi:hypothetical protein